MPFHELTVGAHGVYLVKGLIPRTGLTVVWGPPKCGKSFFAFDLFLHVALDWTYRGRRVKGGPVVYLALEGASGFRARAEAFRQRHLPDEPEPFPFYLCPTPTDLVADVTALIAAIRATAGGQWPVAVVIDTLNRSIRGTESDDKDMTAYIQAADAIRNAFACAVVVVHHSGHDQSRMRGHTALMGALDCQIAVSRDVHNTILVNVERMKDGEEGETFGLALERVEVGTDEDGEAITSCVVIDAEVSRQPGRQARNYPTGNRTASRSCATCALTVQPLINPGDLPA